MKREASMITKNKLAAMIDHTNLHAYANHADMKKLCDEAIQHHFAMVAINSCQTAYCHELLKDTGIHVGAAIGFPLGQQTAEVKLFEAADAISHGADEIDYVINITEVKEGNYAYIEDEMRRMTELCKKNKVICKVIFETCYLSRDEIIRLCRIAKEVKPDFIKTSTGFGTAGATVENVRLMKETVGSDVKVKAAGGIRTLKQALEMIDAGAERIGTSRGTDIMRECI